VSKTKEENGTIREDIPQEMVANEFSPTKNQASIDFRDKVLSKFRTTEAGEICATDEMISTVGFREWAEGNRENRSAVMNSENAQTYSDTF
jgi:hypothetical protein